jgi:hypothetical protein
VLPNAVATRGLPYVLLGVAAGLLSGKPQLRRWVAELLDGLERWRGDRRIVNNLAPDEAGTPRRFTAGALRRLGVDQENLRPRQHVQAKS